MLLHIALYGALSTGRREEHTVISQIKDIFSSAHSHTANYWQLLARPACVLQLILFKEIIFIYLKTHSENKTQRCVNVA